MEKKKAILKIESYSSKDGVLVLSTNDIGLRTIVGGVSKLCEEKYGGYIRLEMSPPYKGRTTGENSQNNLIWKLITLIAEETGNELGDVEEAVKERATRRGYPFHVNKITGKMNPESMTKINTVEAGYLIDELLQICSELGIDTES